MIYFYSCWKNTTFFGSYFSSRYGFLLHFRVGCIFFSRRHSRDDVFAACLQRDGGLAQRRLPLPLLRATNVQFRTTFSAGLLPPLRQTARCVLAFYVECLLNFNSFPLKIQIATRGTLVTKYNQQNSEN